MSLGELTLKMKTTTRMMMKRRMTIKQTMTMTETGFVPIVSVRAQRRGRSDKTLRCCCCCC